MKIFDGREIKDPVATLREGRASHPSMETYLGKLQRLYNRNPWYEYIASLAVYVEPIDRDLGRDKDAPSAHAFFHGALLAVDVSQRCLPRDITKTMLRIGLGEDNEDEDFQERVHNIAASIIDNGEVGYTLSPELAEVVDSWEDEITPEVRYQPFIKRGFGAVMYLAHAACELVATTELMNADRDGVDWDSFMTSLSPPEES